METNISNKISQTLNMCLCKEFEEVLPYLHKGKKDDHGFAHGRMVWVSRNCDCYTLADNPQENQEIYEDLVYKCEQVGGCSRNIRRQKAVIMDCINYIRCIWVVVQGEYSYDYSKIYVFGGFLRSLFSDEKDPIKDLDIFLFKDGECKDKLFSTLKQKISRALLRNKNNRLGTREECYLNSKEEGNYDLDAYKIKLTTSRRNSIYGHDVISKFGIDIVTDCCEEYQSGNRKSNIDFDVNNLMISFNGECFDEIEFRKPIEGMEIKDVVTNIKNKYANFSLDVSDVIRDVVSMKSCDMFTNLMTISIDHSLIERKLKNIEGRIQKILDKGYTIVDKEKFCSFPVLHQYVYDVFMENCKHRSRCDVCGERLFRLETNYETPGKKPYLVSFKRREKFCVCEDCKHVEICYYGNCSRISMKKLRRGCKERYLCEKHYRELLVDDLNYYTMFEHDGELYQVGDTDLPWRELYYGKDGKIKKEMKDKCRYAINKANLIGEWFLKCRYDPAYAYCRRIQYEEFVEICDERMKGLTTTYASKVAY